VGLIERFKVFYFWCF